MGGRKGQPMPRFGQREKGHVRAFESSPQPILGVLFVYLIALTLSWEFCFGILSVPLKVLPMPLKVFALLKDTTQNIVLLF